MHTDASTVWLMQTIFRTSCYHGLCAKAQEIWNALKQHGKDMACCCLFWTKVFWKYFDHQEEPQGCHLNFRNLSYHCATADEQHIV